SASVCPSARLSQRCYWGAAGWKALAQTRWRVDRIGRTMVRFLTSLAGLGRGAAAYVTAREADPDFKANTAEVDGLKETLTVEEAKLVAEFVKDLSSAEAAREASIQSRAQGLLVGQA